MTGDRIRYVEAARIALDDAYREQQFDPGLMLQRAQVFATLAGVEQARIGNLVAWKQLRQTAASSTSSLPNSGDAIADEIEETLGILDPQAAPTRPVAGSLAEQLAERTIWTAEEWQRLIDLAQQTDGAVILIPGSAAARAVSAALTDAGPAGQDGDLLRRIAEQLR